MDNTMKLADMQRDIKVIEKDIETKKNDIATSVKDIAQKEQDKTRICAENESLKHREYSEEEKRYFNVTSKYPKFK